MSPGHDAAGTWLQQQRTMVGALVGGVLVIAAVLALVLPTGAPPWWALAAVLAAAVVSQTLVAAVGYRVPPMQAGAVPEETAPSLLLAAQTSTTVRFALSEMTAIIGVALAFVTQSWWVCALGATIAAVAIWRHCWPSDALLARLERAFDREGGRSHLVDVAHGREPGSGNGPMLPF